MAEIGNLRPGGAEVGVQGGDHRLHEALSAAARGLGHAADLGGVARQRLLAQYMLSALQSAESIGTMSGIGRADIYCVNVGACRHLPDGGEHERIGAKGLGMPGDESPRTVGATGTHGNRPEP